MVINKLRQFIKLRLSFKRFSSCCCRLWNDCSPLRWDEQYIKQEKTQQREGSYQFPHIQNYLKSTTVTLGRKFSKCAL